MENYRSPRHEAAVQYADKHWSIIPMNAQDKRPLIKWQEYQHRCATTDEINEWYQRWPEANVGIVTGAISGVVVLDIDPKHGGDESLATWLREQSPLPRTVEAITGGGGRHLYFKHPGGVVHNRVGLAPGIDLRGDGGCVVAPPSIHASGIAYRWVHGHEPGKMPVAELPVWLSGMLIGEGARGHTLHYWRQLVLEGVGEGERNNTIASLTGHLLWHGVDADVAMELMIGWNRLRCKPPLNDEEVIQTVQSITRLHEHNE